MYRYGANWYGYLALNRLTTLRNQGNCRSTSPPNETIAKAIANLRIVTVAAETATDKELARAAKGEELSTIGLFDWAIDELQEAKRPPTTAQRSISPRKTLPAKRRQHGGICRPAKELSRLLRRCFRRKWAARNGTFSTR